MKHGSEPAQHLSSARSDVPAHVDVLVARLLEKDPAHRPPAAEALAMLDGALDTARAPGRVETRQRVMTNPHAVVAPSVERPGTSCTMRSSYRVSICQVPSSVRT
jgi:hypothetical protein